MNAITRDSSFAVRTTLGFQESLDLLRRKLQRDGFRVVSEVHFHREFEKRVGIEWPKYTVLVIWSPFLAYQALLSDRDGGLLVPFNLAVAEDSGATLITTPNHSWAALRERPIGIQVLVRELNRKLRQIFLELAIQETAVNCEVPHRAAKGTP